MIAINLGLPIFEWDQLAAFRAVFSAYVHSKEEAAHNPPILRIYRAEFRQFPNIFLPKLKLKSTQDGIAVQLPAKDEYLRALLLNDEDHKGQHNPRVLVLFPEAP